LSLAAFPHASTIAGRARSAADAVDPGAGRAAHRRRHRAGCILGGKAPGNVLCELDQAVAPPAADLGVWLWNRRRAKTWVVLVAASGAGGGEFFMTEHAGLIQVTTFRPAPGRRDEVLALCAETQQRAAAADGCFGAQTCAVDEDPDAVVAISRWRDRHSLEAFQAAAGGSPSDPVRDVLIGVPVTRHYAPAG
jgi:quinol monooxygenase YgiN